MDPRPKSWVPREHGFFGGRINHKTVGHLPNKHMENMSFDILRHGFTMIDINCRLATSDMFERTTHQKSSPKCGYDFPVISCNYIIVTKTRIEWSFHNLPTVLKQVAEHPNTSQLRKIPVQKTAEKSKIWENTPAGKPKQALQCKKAINFLSFFLQYALSNSITFLSTSPYLHQSSRKCVTTLPSLINWLVLSIPLKK